MLQFRFAKKTGINLPDVTPEIEKKLVEFRDTLPCYKKEQYRSTLYEIGH